MITPPLDENVDDLTDASPSNTANAVDEHRSGLFGSASTPLARLTGPDVAVLAALVLIPCAYLPMLSASFWSARLIVLLALAPAGLWALLRLVRLGDVAARWASGALAFSVVAALLSGNISASLRGWAGQDASVLSFAGVFGLWALARFMSPYGRSLVTPAFLFAAGLNAAVGALQVLFQVSDGDLALLFGRAVGLTPNPVYFGALMVGATALCIGQAGSTEVARTWPWQIGVFVFAVSVAFSGSRIALVALVLVAVGGVWRSRSIPSVIAAIVAAAGATTGSLLVRSLGTGNDSLSRLGQSGSDGRFKYWQASTEAIAERPIFGWGLGRFRFATQGRFTVDEMAGLDSAHPFFDAHNIVLALAVAVGVPGLLMFAGFVWTAARSVRPVLAFTAAAIAITWLMQPAGLTTLPLVLVLLGVTSNDAPGTLFPSTTRGRAGFSAAIVVGLVPAAWLGYAEYELAQAFDSIDAIATRDAAELYLDDPVITNVVAHIAETTAEFDEDARELMFDAYRRSAELDPGRPHWWIELARREGAYGDPAAAKVSAQRAIDLDPFNTQAWAVMRFVGRDLEDVALEREALTVLCDLKTEGACEAIAELDSVGP